MVKTTLDTRLLNRHARRKAAAEERAKVLTKSDPAVTYDQAGDVIGVSMWTVRRLIAAGKLQGIKLSERRVGVRLSEIKRYLDEAEAT